MIASLTCSRVAFEQVVCLLLISNMVNMKTYLLV